MFLINFVKFIVFDKVARDDLVTISLVGVVAQLGQREEIDVIRRRILRLRCHPTSPRTHFLTNFVKSIALIDPLKFPSTSRYMYQHKKKLQCESWRFLF